MVKFDADGSQLSKTVTELERTITGASNTAQQSGGIFGKFGNDVKQGIMMGFGLSTVGLVTSAIGLIKDGIGKVISTGMEFEQSMANVKAITGATGDEFKQLTDLARHMGATTQMTASESAEAISKLGMAGWDTKEIMAGLPAVLDLTVASGQEMAFVADAVSDQLTAFGYSAKDATMYSDALAYAMTSANVDMTTLTESLKYIAPVAQTTGFSMQETVSAVMMLGDAGIKGSQAGTTLRTVMLNLTGANQKATDTLKDLGVAVYDSEGKTRKLADIMRDLDKATQGMTDAQKANTYNTLVGKTAVAGFSTLMEQGAGKLETYTTGVYNSSGATAEMAEIMGDTAEGKAKRLQSALDELSITLYDKVSPFLAKGTEDLTNFISWVSNGFKHVEDLSEANRLFGDSLETVSDKVINTLTPFQDMQREIGSLTEVTKTLGSVSGATYDEMLAKTQENFTQSKELLARKQEEEWGMITTYSQKYLMADAEEKAKLKEQFDSFYTQKTKLMDSREKEISEIINTAKERNVSLTEEECNRINTLTSLNMKDLVRIASDSYEEQTALLNAYKTNEKKITADTAKMILDNATKTKDGVIKEAEARLQGELSSANALRKASAITEQEYNKMVSDATMNYDQIAKKADSGFNEVKDSIVKAITDAGGKYNEKTGELTDSHGKLVANLKDNPPTTEIKANDKASPVIDNVNKKMNSLNGKKATVTITTRENTVKGRTQYDGGYRTTQAIASSYLNTGVRGITGRDTVTTPNTSTINYNGNMVFNDKSDIDYFMRKTARMIERNY